jgi:SAM-dependent methyltransferase
VVDRFGVALSARAVHRNVRCEGKRVADIGCGFDATLARTLLPKAASLTLVDVALSDELKADPRIRSIEGSVTDVLPTLANDSVDVLLCLSVLEHLWDPLDALQQFHRILAPGRTLLVNVPTWRGKWFLELAAFRLHVSPAAEMDDHKHYFDPRDLWPLLVRAGFRPSDISCRRHKFGLNTFAVCHKVEAVP